MLSDVGRSCILVTIGGKNLMLDCGMHMGFNDDVSQLRNISCFMATLVSLSVVLWGCSLFFIVSPSVVLWGSSLFLNVSPIISLFFIVIFKYSIVIQQYSHLFASTCYCEPLCDLTSKLNIAKTASLRLRVLPIIWWQVSILFEKNFYIYWVTAKFQ